MDTQGSELVGEWKTRGVFRLVTTRLLSCLIHSGRLPREFMTGPRARDKRMHLATLVYVLGYSVVLL